MEIVDSLVSDHFALNVQLNAQQKLGTASRKRLYFKPENKEHFIESISHWYNSYTPDNVHDFVCDLNNRVELTLESPVHSKANKRRTRNYTNTKRWYNDDLKVQYFNKLVKGVAKKWRQNPSDENREVLQFISEKSC